MTTAIRGFKMEMSEASTVVDIYSNLAANTAVSQEELAVAMSKTASSMESVGSSFQDTSAMIATMVAVTRESATNIGSAMKSIASRYGELTKDPTKLLDSEGEAMSFNKVDEALKSVGISLQDTEHQFRSLTDVITELADKWDTLDSAQQRYIATQFAGNRQQSRFLALVSNKDLLAANMEVADNSENIGDLQALKALDSIESKLNQVKVAYQQFYTTLGAESLWKTLLDGTKNFINNLNNLPKLFGKLPVNAIMVVADAINLVKGVALDALASVANQWKDIISKQSSETTTTAGQSGQKAGDDWISGAIQAIRSRTDELKGAKEEALKENEVNKEKNQNIVDFGEENFKRYLAVGWSGAGLRDTKSNLVFDRENDGNLALKQIFNDLSNINALTPQVQGNIEKIFDKEGFSDIFVNYLNEVYQGLINEGNAALESANKTNVFKTAINTVKNLAATSTHLSSDLQGLGSALRLISTLFNTSSQSGKKLSGSLMTISGALTLASAAVKIYQGSLKKSAAAEALQAAIEKQRAAQAALNIASIEGEAAAQTELAVATTAAAKAQEEYAAAQSIAFPWMAVAMAAVSIINGLTTAIESNQERLERLQQEAEDLSNEAKQAKADYNDLQRTADKLDELKEKRYDNTEAAEEYQTAIDDLANKFPQLITRLDDMGNVVIEDTNLEYALEEARESAAEATLAAIKAEREKTKEELRQAKNSLDQQRNDFLVYSKDSNGIYGDINPDGLNTYLNNLKTPSYFSKQDSTLRRLRFNNKTQYRNSLDDLIGNAYDTYGRLDVQAFLKEHSNFGGISESNGVYFINDANKLTQSLSEFIYDAEDFVNLLIGNSLEEVNTIQKDINELYKSADDEQEFKKNLQSIKKTIDQAGLQGVFPVFEDFATDYINGLKTVDDFTEVLDSENRQQLSAEIKNLGKSNEEFVKSLGEGENILVSYLDQKSKDYGNLEDYIADQNDGLQKDYEGFKEEYESVNFDSKKFNEMWENRSQYTAKDFQTVFNELPENSAILEGINLYYKKQINSYQDRLKEKIDHLNDLNINFNLPDTIQIENISKDLAEWLTNSFNIIEEYTKEGMTNAADDVASATSQLLNSLYSDDINETQRAALVGAMKNYDINTIDGIDSIINDIEGMDGADIILPGLNALKESLIYNLPLSIQTYTDQIGSEADELSKDIKNLSKGKSASEALKILDTINADGKTTATLADFSEKNGEFYLKDSELRKRYIEQRTKELISAEKIQKEIDKIPDYNSNLLEGLVSETYGNWPVNKNADENLFNTLNSLGFVEEINDTQYILNEDGRATYEKWKSLSENQDKGLGEFLQEYFKNQLKTAEELEEWINTRISLQDKLDNGEYNDYLSALGISEVLSREDAIQALLDWSNNKGNFSLVGIDSKDLKEGYDALTSSTSSFASDVMNGDLKAIALELENDTDNKYAGVSQAAIDAFNALNNGSGKWVDFAKIVAEQAGWTAEETRKQIVEAEKKDNEQSLQAQKSALSKFKVNGTKLTGSSSDINALADAFNLTAEATSSLFGEQIDADTFELNLDPTIAGIGAILSILSNVIEQSIPNQLKNYADTLKNGFDYISKGTTDFSKMESFAKEYSKALYGTEDAVSWDTIFKYDDISESYTLSIDAFNSYINAERKILEEADASDEQISQILDQATKEYTGAIKATDFVKNKNKTDKDRKQMQKSLEDYYTIQMESTLNTISNEEEKEAVLSDIKERAENDTKALEQGGAAAVEVLRGLLSDGEELSSDDIKEAYLAEVNQYKDAFSEIKDGLVKGSIVISDALKSALEKENAGFDIDENGVIQVVGSMVQAYKNLYEGMKATGEATVTDLNAAYLQLIQGNTNKESVGMEMLSSASNLNISALENFASTMEFELENIINETGNVVDEWANVISRTGIDSYEITDWDSLLQKLDEGLGVKLDDHSKEYIDAYVSWLQSDANVAPNAKEALMTSLIPNMEKLTYAQIGQIAKTFNATVDQILTIIGKEGDNGDGTFNGGNLIRLLNFDKTNEEFARALSTQLQTVTSNMTSAMVAFVEAGSDGRRTVLDFSNLKQAISDFEKGMQAFGQNISVQNLVLALTQGGEAAVAAAEQIAALSGQELTASDIETLYRGQVGKLVNAIDTVVAKPGEIVDAITASIIGFDNVNQIGETGQYVVETAANLYEAYNKLLQRMAATGEATLADLNKVAALALENRDSEQQVIDALGDAAGMTFTRFGEILADAGIQLTEDMVNQLEAAGIIDLMGGNKMKIVDFQAFADLMKWDADSEEYVSAFKSYNDSMIEMNRQTERNILEETKNAMSAQGGDWVNLTQLVDSLNKIEQESLSNWKAALEHGANAELNTPLPDLQNAVAQYGASIEDGILKLEPNANILAIMQEIAQAAAESGGLLSNELAELADAVADAIKGYADLIKGSIEGSLSETEANSLQQFANSRGLGQLDFTRTAIGLKVSEQSATKLYFEISKIDAIQGKLVFDSLRSSLEASNGQVANISKTINAITDIQNKMRENASEIARLEKEGAEKTKIDKIQAENRGLQQQLNLYKQIATAQSSDPEQFNFMNRSMPDSFQGPINYWDSVGKAFDVMNSSAKTGKMAIQDFYNIVNEMSNQAQLSGQEIEFMGFKIDGSAENAAALIQKGFNALSNVDGKGVQIDLGKLGANISGGAENMAKGFDSGIKSMAQSQIKMLDAAINMLEAIVAMENIDVNGDNFLDMGEIFANGVDLSEGFTKPVEEWITELETLSGGIEIGGKSFREALESLEPDEIQNLLNQLYSIDWTLGDTDVFGQIQKVLSGFFIGQEITKGTSIFDILKVPKNAEKDSEEFKQWLKDMELNETQAEVLLEAIEKGRLNADINNSMGQAIVKMLGVTKEQMSTFKSFIGEDQQIDSSEIEMWSKIDLKVDEKSGEVTGAYTASDGSSLTLSDDASNWKNEIEEYESAILVEKTSGGGVSKDTALNGKAHTETLNFSGGSYEIVVDESVEGEPKFYTNFNGSRIGSCSSRAELAEEIEELIAQQNSGGEHYKLDENGDIQYDAEGNVIVEYSWHYEKGLTPEQKSDIEKNASQLAGEIQKGTELKIGQDYEQSGDKIKIKSIPGIEFEASAITGSDGKIDNSKLLSALKTLTGEDDSIGQSVAEGIKTALSDIPGLGEAIGKAIQTALTGLSSNDLGEQEIPEVSAKITDLKITGVDNTSFGGMGQFLANKGIGSNLIIPSASADINNLKLSNVTVDTSSLTTVAEQIIQAIQSALDANPVTVSVSSPTSNPEPQQTDNDTTTTTVTQNVTAIITELDDSLIQNSDSKINVGVSADPESFNTTIGELENNVTVEPKVPIDADTKKFDSALAGATEEAEKEVKKQVSFEGKLASTYDTAFKNATAAVSKNVNFVGTLTENYKNALESATKDVEKKVNFVKGTDNTGGAAGNVALSKGTGRALAGGKTLMGELGPELVVSDGRYFVVGQNGPEMVDLKPDAIVFNHLQTEKLLTNGSVGTHGRPVTNERNATSLATGNVGPAMASASEVLAALKQLRAMWQSLANASLKDMGGMPGGSGGGGGGGGGGNSPKEIKAVIKEVERWYNWLKEIEYTQNNINKLTKEYNLLEKQGLSTQTKLESLQKRYSNLEYEKKTRESLVKEQTAYRASEIKRVNSKSNAFSAFYYADPETGRVVLRNDNNSGFENYLKGHSIKTKGISQSSNLASTIRKGKSVAANTQIKYNHTYTEEEAEKKVNKEYKEWKKANPNVTEKQKKAKKKDLQKQYKAGTKTTKSFKTAYDIKTGADLMDELQRQDESGMNVHNAEEQIALLDTFGFLDSMPAIMAGVDKSQEGWQEQAMENFYAAIDGEKAGIESLTASIEEQQQAALDDAIAMQEINEQILELVKPLAGVTEGFEEWYNELRKIENVIDNINKLTKKRSNLEKDQVANGYEIYKNTEEESAEIEYQIKLDEDLLGKQREKRDTVKNEYKAAGIPIKYDEKRGVATISDEAVTSQQIDISYTDVTRNKQGFAVNKKGNYVDDKGVLYDKKGNRLGSTVYGTTQTDEKGNNLTRQVQYDKKGNMKIDTGNGVIYVDSKGKTIKEENFNKGGKKSDITTTNVTYDENGNFIDRDGTLRNLATGKTPALGEFDTQTVSGTYDTIGKNILQIIDEITAQDATGKTAFNVEQQYKILESLGLTKLFKYDAQGNPLFSDFGELSKDDQKKFVERVIEGIQGSADDINNLTKEGNQTEQEILDLQGRQLEIEQERIDKTIELKDMLKDAVVQEHQDAIDEKTELKDAIDKAANKTVQGLRDSLEKERRLYEGEQNKDDLNSLITKLNLLKSTNGSLSQIRDLEQQIKDKQKDIYFEERELAIDELEDTAQKQVEMLEEQTEKMQTALDYQVKYGLIWDEVNKKLSENSEDGIAAYITDHSSTFASASIEGQTKKLLNVLEIAGFYNGTQRDKKINESLNNLITDENKGLMSDTFRNSVFEAGKIAYDETQGTADERLAAANNAMQAMINTAQGKINASGTVSSLINSAKEGDYKDYEYSDDFISTLTSKGTEAYNSTIGTHEEKTAAARKAIESTITSSGTKVKVPEPEPEPQVDGGSQGVAQAYNLESEGGEQQGDENLRINAPEKLSLQDLIDRVYDADSGWVAAQMEFSSIIDKAKKISPIYGERAIEYAFKNAYNNANSILPSNKYREAGNELKNNKTENKLKSKITDYMKANGKKSLFATKDIGKYKSKEGALAADSKDRVGKLLTGEEIRIVGISKDTRSDKKTKVVKDKDGFWYPLKDGYSYALNIQDLKQYAQGGKIDFTGPAWVDGTKSKPEYIFNSEQMDFLRRGLSNNVNLTNSLVSSIASSLDNLPNSNTYNSINSNDSSVIIEHAEVNVNVEEIANDYDSRRIGEQALNEMVRIARKTGSRSISRR